MLQVVPDVSAFYCQKQAAIFKEVKYFSVYLGITEPSTSDWYWWPFYQYFSNFLFLNIPKKVNKKLQIQ